MAHIQKVETDEEAKNIIKDLSEEQAEKILDEQIANIRNYDIQDIISIVNFFEFLIAPERDKSFLTGKNTIVGKKRVVLQKLHKCKILFAEEK